MIKRTDLAVEQITGEKIPSGVSIKKRGKIFDTTEITIEDDSHRDSLGKGRGKYITMEGGNLGDFSDDYEEMAEEIADELRGLIPDGEIFVAGLGNRDITPDALGVLTAEKILATRHLQNEQFYDRFFSSLRGVSTVSGGVTGQTGIETAELIKAICSEIRPSAIIAVDALACSDVRRLGTTIQITDSGISPGSGVSNSRKEISMKNLGVPVIAVGIPTVVDIHTIIKNFSDKEAEIPNMIVTPKDIDRLTERSSQLLAFGINLALQPLTFSEIRGFF